MGAMVASGDGGVQRSERLERPRQISSARSSRVADGRGVLDAPFDVQAIAGRQLDVTVAKVEHDGAPRAEQHLVVRVRMPVVGIAGAVGPPAAGEPGAVEALVELVTARRNGAAILGMANAVHRSALP
jgi:hypothetical protein